MSRSDSSFRADALRKFPERPESEFEWEDLLLKLEIMPRALRVELERTKQDEAAVVLSALNLRELEIQRLLEAVAIAEQPRTRGGRAVSGEEEGGVPRMPELAPSHPSDLSPAAVELVGSDVERFVRLRGRNFAMLQRRGIDVWNWKVRVSATGQATVFQLLSLLAQDDVESLSRLRKARNEGFDAC